MLNKPPVLTPLQRPSVQNPWPLKKASFRLLPFLNIHLKVVLKAVPEFQMSSHQSHAEGFNKFLQMFDHTFLMCATAHYTLLIVHNGNALLSLFPVVFQKILRCPCGEETDNESVVCTCSEEIQTAFGLYLKSLVNSQGKWLFPFSSSVRPHVLYPGLGSLQYKKDRQLWDHSNRRVTKVAGRLKDRMFKEKLRELGLVSMEKETVGDAVYWDSAERIGQLFSEVQEGQHRKLQFSIRDNSQHEGR